MSKRLGWLLLIMFLVLMTFNVTSQIKHNMSKKNSIQEEIKIVNKKIEEKIHLIGMMFLLVLMLIIVFFDIAKYF